jgi:hypothetical protein
VVALLALGGCAATPPPVPVSKRIPALVCTPSLYIRADGNGLRSLLCYAPDDRGRIEVFEQEIAK